MPRGNAPESPHNGGLKTIWNALFEGSEPVLQEAPARLDRTGFGIEARNEPVTNEVDEPRPVHGAVQRLVDQNPVGAHISRAEASRETGPRKSSAETLRQRSPERRAPIRVGA